MVLPALSAGGAPRAGPRQSPENPLGEGGLQLHEWIFQTRSMHELQGRDGGEADEVLGIAMQAAGGQDVALGGGPATIRQFLAAGLVDEMHLAIAPVLLGEGERLFGHLPAGHRRFRAPG